MSWLCRSSHRSEAWSEDKVSSDSPSSTSRVFGRELELSTGSLACGPRKMRRSFLLCSSFQPGLLPASAHDRAQKQKSAVFLRTVESTNVLCVSRLRRCPAHGFRPNRIASPQSSRCRARSSWCQGSAAGAPRGSVNRKCSYRISVALKRGLRGIRDTRSTHRTRRTRLCRNAPGQNPRQTMKPALSSGLGMFPGPSSSRQSPDSGSSWIRIWEAAADRESVISCYRARAHLFRPKIPACAEHIQEIPEPWCSRGKIGLG